MADRKGRRKIEKVFTDKTRTQQNYKEDSDVNNVMKRFNRTGVLTTGMQGNRQPMFGNFTSMDFQSMMNTLVDAQQAFAMLPSRIRGRFKNDPYQVVRFVENPDNYDEAVRLGLLAPRPMSFDEAYNAAQDAAEEAARKAQAAADAEAKAKRMAEIREAFRADPEANPYKAPAPAGD